MKKSAQWLLAFGVVLAMCSCGDDDDDSSGGGGSSGGSAGRAGSSSSAGRGGGGSVAGSGGSTAHSGDTEEGGLCSGNMDCTSGLNCVISAFDDETLATVCGRPCTGDGSCDSGEFCATATGKPADAHCISMQTEALGKCGPGDTSICDEALLCLPDLTLDEPFGTCFNLCKLPSTTQSSPAILENCPSGQSCVDVGAEDAGLCGFPVARGEACAITGGKLCNSGDICITEVNPDRTAGASLCYQECTLNGMCADGKTCTAIDPSGSDQTKFCM